MKTPTSGYPAVEVSVVIPCHAAHAAVLPHCLASVRSQLCRCAYEIIVVNSNGDDAVARAAAPFQVKLVSGRGPLTAGAARNRGVEIAVGELVAFIDADCVAEPDWLRALAEGLTRELVAVSGPVLNYLPLHPIATVDNLMQFVDQLPGRPPGPITSAPSSNLAVRRSEFLSIGAFPEDVQPGQDTLLTSALAERWPGRMRFLPAMRVKHRGRTSLREFLPHQRAFGLSRGRYRLNLSARRQQLGAYAVIAALDALRRLVYVMGRTAQWRLAALPYLMLLSPVLLIGLAAWARGFQAGCRLAAIDSRAGITGRSSSGAAR